MQFLRTLFWVLATAIVVVFTMHNWQPVTIHLFGGLEADVKLPVLLLIAFLIGFVPLYLYYRTALWRARRQAATTAIVTPLPTEQATPASTAAPTGVVPPLSDAF